MVKCQRVRNCRIVPAQLVRGKPIMAQARSAAELRSGRAPARPVSPKALRGIPQIHALLELEAVRRAAAHYGRRLVTAVVRERLNTLRRLVRSGALKAA